MNLPALWLWLLVAAVSASAGAGIAWRVASDRGAARLAECEQTRAKDARAASEAAANLLKKSEASEVAAARRLAAAQAESERKIKETRREIYALGTGRECLSGALRMRLNAALSAPDIDLPEPAGAAAHAASEPAGDPAHGASDTGVALWMADAIARYDDCRARIDALRAWSEGVNHGQH